MLFSAEQYRLGLKDVMPGWNNFQAKCHKMFKPLGKGRSKHHFFIVLLIFFMMFSFPVSSKIFLTTISNGGTMKSEEVNTLGWVKA